MNQPSLEKTEDLIKHAGYGKQLFAEFLKALVLVLVPISALQGVLFALEGTLGYYEIAGVLLAVVTIVFALKYLATRAIWLLQLVSILLLVQFGLFVIGLAGIEPPFPLRLLQVAILISYFVIFMATLLIGTRLIAPAHAFLVACATGMGVFIVEAVQELPRFSLQTAGGDVEWSASFQSHPVLGERYAANSEVKTYYPDNPRGYFKTEDPRKSKWRLNVHDGSLAELSFPDENSDRVRIEIKNARTKVPWHVQLNESRISVRQGRAYSLTFTVRADRPRRIIAAVSRNHEPWDNLGLYEDVELASQWQKSRLDFVAVATDDNARIHFDVAGSDSSLDVSDVTLRSLSDGEVVKPVLREKYFVSYRINSKGCRGPDYSLPRQKDTARILVLGDSYTMGVGVHEEDTFSNQLEQLLNRRAHRSRLGVKYEVINCGQSGYSTRDERLLYEVLGAQYEPDLVLLVMYSNDNISWSEEQKLPHVSRHPQKLEHLFFTWGHIQRYLNSPPFPDYTGCLEEVLRLRSDTRKGGARLAVVFFRDIPVSMDPTIDGKYWNALANTVRKGLQETDIPILDLRDAFFGHHSREDLLVHPIDQHTNEIAHAIAAREIVTFLDKEHLLDSPATSPGSGNNAQKG
jgi:hypothetical protein